MLRYILPALFVVLGTILWLLSYRWKDESLKKWLMRVAAICLIIVSGFAFFSEQLNSWANQNASLLSVFGNFGQFAAAIFAALAAGLSWKSISVANQEATRASEEAALSRKAFQYSWEPLLEVKFETAAHINLRGAAHYSGNHQGILILPRDGNMDNKYKSLSENAQQVNMRFLNWRDKFANYSMYTDLLGEQHPEDNYLALTLQNLQKNPAGQAIHVRVWVEFTCADPEQQIDELRSFPKPLVTCVVFWLERLSPTEKVIAWIGDITSIPHFKAKVIALECRTWNEESLITRGICGTVDLSNDGPKFSVDLKYNQKSIPEEEAVELYPVYSVSDTNNLESRVDIINIDSKTPLRVTVENPERNN